MRVIIVGLYLLILHIAMLLIKVSLYGLEHVDGSELARRGTLYVKIIHFSRKIP